MESFAKADKGRPSRKRVITEARREQNRVAQLAYRRRQKEIRLQKKAQALSQDPSTQGCKLDLRPKEVTRAEDPPTESLYPNRDSSVTQSRAPAEGSGPDPVENRPKSPLSVRTEPERSVSSDDQAYAGDKPRLFPLPILKSSTFFPSIDFSTAQSSIDCSSLASELLAFNGIDQGLSSTWTLFPETTTSELLEQDEISQSSLPFSDPIGTAMPLLSDDSLRIDDSWGQLTNVVPPPRPLRPTRRVTIPDGERTWDVTMPFTARSIGVEDIVAAGMQVLLFNRPSHPSTRKRIQSAESSFNLPSPYRNTLDISRTRTLSACLHNARSMGFAISDVIKPFCIAPSLFYRPHSPGDDLSALVQSAASSNPSMPENLRPTLQQVLHPHPAFLDLIPIPSFRNKVIMAAVKRGWEQVGVGGLNLFELKRDIFQDGLSWQSPDLYGDKGDKIEPWDMGSWEASGWFVRKWSCLIDDAVSVNA